MKKKALVIGGSSNQSFAMGSFLVNIKVVCPDIADEFVIFHDGALPESDMQFMAQILPIRFIEYRLPEVVADVLKSGAGHFTPMVFCKYECFKLLADYSTVVWSDYDTVILDDFSEVFTPTAPIKMLLMENGSAQSFLNPIEEYDMNTWGVCGSLFALQDSLEQYTDMYNFCYEKLYVYCQNLKMGEQAIFDILLQEFCLKPERLQHSIYTPHPSEYAQNPDAKILHAYGGPKFWNGLENVLWQKYYAQWRSMGGSSYKQPPNVNGLHKRILRKLKKLLLPTDSSL